MKKMRFVLVALCLFLVLNTSLSAQPLKKTNPVNDDWDEMDCTKNIKYKLATKKRLDQIYHRIYMDYLSLIETYAWSGALTTAQKEVRKKMLRNYILTFQRRNYQWCSEHEPDEWEEEWYNND